MTPQKRYYEKNKARHLQWTKDWQRSHYDYTIWSSARMRAKRDNIEFTIKPEDVVIPEYCPYIGCKIVPHGNRTEGYGASIDRIDNNKGYTKDNIIVCSLRANRLKSNGTVEEFKKIISYLDTLSY